ncbi:hypothetical protein SAMN05421780_102213 [Flexibacter flexilis DSM 6793]|uniref:Transferase hexapeptide (Six repeat-containing protein) n=1 Tax=Flexibacter flexilis DSM 6793 TaxID=927664 RepID=A0A1I1FJ07_9BACT|nr:hypothetical protein [Flexibacter flexilis]SFB99397.1 hypothetical protein SAMN05421780_102213 [Flexibacter flexilis DSM 6793]
MKNIIIRFYTWSVRTILFFLPETEKVNLFRGWLYSWVLKDCKGDFRVGHDVLLKNPQWISVGYGVHINMGCQLMGGNITIGDRVLFGPMVLVAAGNHTFDGKDYFTGFERGHIHIGSGCWIGGNSSLLMGTNIPNGCVVGGLVLFVQNLFQKKIV